MAELIQGTDQWKATRCGLVTASRVADVIAKTKSGYSASRANYKAQLVAERLTGDVADSFTNAAMQWGTEKEPDARSAYEFITAQSVSEVGFVHHPSIEKSGASPDGLIDETGLVEIKCPNTATHIETLLSGKIPTKYETQMLWQMACTGREWCDFVSYDPRLPGSMQLFVKRLERDQGRINELEHEVMSFLEEVADTVEQLTRKFEEAA